MIDETEVVKMYQSGMSSNDIATELGIAVTEVRAILEKAGMTLKPGRKSAAETFGPEQREAMIKEYLDEKVPAVQLIQRYGLTWNAFYKVLDEEAVPFREMRQEDRISRERRLERALEMYAGGARIWEIENETGVRQPVLHAALHRRGIPLRRMVTPPE